MRREITIRRTVTVTTGSPVKPGVRCGVTYRAPASDTGLSSRSGITSSGVSLKYPSNSSSTASSLSR